MRTVVYIKDNKGKVNNKMNNVASDFGLNINLFKQHYSFTKGKYNLLINLLNGNLHIIMNLKLMKN